MQLEDVRPEQQSMTFSMCGEISDLLETKTLEGRRKVSGETKIAIVHEDVEFPQKYNFWWENG